MQKTILLAAALLSAFPAKASDSQFRNGLELLIACSDTMAEKDARTFHSCMDEILVRVSELSGRGPGCPRTATKEDLADWVVGGRQILLHHWRNDLVAAERVSSDQAIDAMVRARGYSKCVDSMGS